MADKFLIVREGAQGLALERRDMSETDYNILHADEIDGTTQTIVYADGVISQIIHTGINDTVVRTDNFTFSADQIVEERVAANGAKLTITTNLADLSTETVYTPAE